MDHSDAEEQSRCASSSSRLGLRFGTRRAKRRSGSHQHLLLMDCVVGSDNGDASEETGPLPDYERLSHTARLPDDPPPPSTPVQQQQQKPAAWSLIEYVRSRHRVGGGGGSDGDSKSSDGEKEGEDCGEVGKTKEEEEEKKKKKRSSWLPDPDRRWPVQGFY